MSIGPHTPGRRNTRPTTNDVRPPDHEQQRRLRLCGMDDETIQLSREEERWDELERLNSHGPANAMRWAA